MRRLFALLAAAGVALLGVAAASAGTLSGATLDTVAQGHPVSVAGVGATGASTATSATLDGGSAFATMKTLSTTGTVTGVFLELGNNGAISVTHGGAIHTAAPITGKFSATGLGGVQLLSIPLAFGRAGTTYRTGLGGNIQLTIIGNGWTLGQARQTGLTTSGFPLPNVTTTGSFNLDGAGVGTVKLVTVGRVVVAGLQQSTTAAPTTLTLTYAAPEPGSLLLLGAGIVGLAALGRNKRSA